MNLVHEKQMWTTGMVAQALSTTDTREGMGESTDEQASNIELFVKAMTGRKPQQSGSMSSTTPYGQAHAWMMMFPDGTVFAISVTGTLLHSSDSSRRGHWLNAKKVGGVITFFDSQTNRTFRTGVPEGGTNPSSSNAPFVGIIPQLSSNQTSGTLDPSGLTCVVLAFPP